MSAAGLLVREIFLVRYADPSPPLLSQFIAPFGIFAEVGIVFVSVTRVC